MATQVSGRGGHREGAGRPGSNEAASSVRIGLRAQGLASELATKLGISKRQVIEDAIYEWHRIKDQEEWVKNFPELDETKPNNSTLDIDD